MDDLFRRICDGPVESEVQKPTGTEFAAAAAAAVVTGAARAAVSGAVLSTVTATMQLAVGRVTPAAAAKQVLRGAVTEAATAAIADTVTLTINYTTDSVGLLNQLAGASVAGYSVARVQGARRSDALRAAGVGAGFNLALVVALGHDEVVLNSRLPDSVNSKFNDAVELVRTPIHAVTNKFTDLVGSKVN